MPEVSSSEYLHSLLLAFQNAEKMYCQSVSDVVEAEIRRDEAMKQKDEAYFRLEEAREKYSGGTMVQEQPDGHGEKNRLSNNLPQLRISGTSNSFGQNDRPKSDSKTCDIRSNGNNAFNGEASKEVEQHGVSTTFTDRLGSNGSKDGGGTHDKKPSPILQSPRAGSKKAPSIFRKASARRLSKNRALGKKSSTSTGVLEPLSSPNNLLELSKGRTREWLDKHLDCDRVGLVRKFYQGLFGTKTNQETKKLSVSSIVLNDEWNDLVADSSEIQELYVSKNTNNSANTNSGLLQRSLRDKAAEALVSPQKEPIALFFAPKKMTGPSNLFYAGHWRVIDGQTLDPPKFVKGQARQCQVKFEFVGVDKAIIHALNED